MKKAVLILLLIFLVYPFKAHAADEWQLSYDKSSAKDFKAATIVIIEYNDPLFSRPVVKKITPSSVKSLTITRKYPTLPGSGENIDHLIHITILDTNTLNFDMFGSGIRFGHKTTVSATNNGDLQLTPPDKFDYNENGVEYDMVNILATAVEGAYTEEAKKGALTGKIKFHMTFTVMGDLVINGVKSNPYPARITIKVGASNVGQ